MADNSIGKIISRLVNGPEIDQSNFTKPENLLYQWAYRDICGNHYVVSPTLMTEKAAGEAFKEMFSYMKMSGPFYDL